MWWYDPPKGFSLDRHIKKVGGMERHMGLYLGKPFTEPVAQDMYEHLSRKLRYPCAAHLALRASEVITPDGREFTTTEARCVGLFLLEHHDALRRDELPKQWAGTPPLWMCVRFTQLARMQGLPPGKPMQYFCKCLVITGPASGQMFTLPLNPRYAYYLPHILGCPKNMPVDPYDAKSMHGFAKIGTQRGRPAALMELEATTALKTKNKRIHRRRHNL